ncbi:MAG: hypothetical protein LBB29_01765 [Holosporaceae bacterium]|jgi:hypothetical protein|nr:hypothetical protein [Holosporaceae bacterium]
MKAFTSLILFAFFCFVNVWGMEQNNTTPNLTSSNVSTHVAPLPTATSPQNPKDLQTIENMVSAFDADFFHKRFLEKYDPHTAKIMAAVCSKNTEQLDPSDIHLAIARSLDSNGFGKARPILDNTVKLWKRLRTFLGVIRNISFVTAGTATILCAVFPQWRDICFIVTEISGPMAAALWPTCSYAQGRVDKQIQQNLLQNLMTNTPSDAENGKAINLIAKSDDTSDESGSNGEQEEDMQY